VRVVIAWAALSVLAVASAAAQGANPSGQDRCMQGCGGPNPTFVRHRPYIVVSRRPEAIVATPPSAYEVYDSLKGREMCYLPSGPCDNNQRVQN
jgi:hypothetical protein